MTQGRRLIFVYVPSKHQAVIVSTFILTRIYGRDDLNLTISMADQSYYRTPKKEREEFYAKRNLRLKRMESSDLEAVDDLCRDVHFDIGYHNLKLYYEMSPDTWDIVLDENGQVLVADGLNMLSNGIVYAYVITTRMSWRGKGLTGPITPDFQGTAIMASSTDETLKRYNMHGQHWLEKRHGLYGFCPRRRSEALDAPPVPGVIVERLRPELMSHLLEYDQKVALIEREQFVKEWCLPRDKSHGETILALDQATGRCLGYGTMRLFSDYYGIQPLYADSDQIALALMTALTKWCLNADVYLYMPLMASKRTAMKFCYDLDMVITGTETRNCSALALDYASSLPIEKIYSVHEYYPV